MPRHPPCALHSLSHKHSTKTTNYKDRSPTHPRPPSNHQRAQRDPTRHEEINNATTTIRRWRDARVHYPVHKQPAHQPKTHTNRCALPKEASRHQPHPHPPPDTHPKTSPAQQHVNSLIPQGPTVCQPPTRAPDTPGSTPHPPITTPTKETATANEAVLRSIDPHERVLHRRFH